MRPLSVSPLLWAGFAASCLLGMVQCSGESETSTPAPSNGGGGVGGRTNVAGGAGSGGKVTTPEAAGNGDVGGEGGVVGVVGDPGCTRILTATGLDTGFENCADGTKRRRVAIRCPTEETGTPADGCFEDSDCEAGSICECGVSAGVCKPATCRSGADCAPGFGCVSSALRIDPNMYGVGGDGNLDSGECYYPTAHATYACQSTFDRCHIDSDCMTDLEPMARCVFDGFGRDCIGILCPE